MQNFEPDLVESGLRVWMPLASGCYRPQVSGVPAYGRKPTSVLGVNVNAIDPRTMYRGAAVAGLP